jgi:hypothetical protein
VIFESDIELANALRKLRLLEDSYAEASGDTSEGEYVRELELRTLRRLIKELKEDIVGCQTRGRGRLRRHVLSEGELATPAANYPSLRAC